MKYIKMFGNIENLKVGKPTKVRYERMKEFIKTKELATRLDELKVPNWWVMLYVDKYIWQFLVCLGSYIIFNDRSWAANSFFNPFWSRIQFGGLPCLTLRAPRRMRRRRRHEIESLRTPVDLEK